MRFKTCTLIISVLCMSLVTAMPLLAGFSLPKLSWPWSSKATGTDANNWFESIEKNYLTGAKGILDTKFPLKKDRYGQLLTRTVGDLTPAEFKKLRNFLDQKDQNGDSGLIIATRRGYPKFVQWLIDIGADVNATDKEGKTALMITVSREGQATTQDQTVQEGLALKLLNAPDANAGFGMQDSTGKTALIYAAANPSLPTRMITRLLEIPAIKNTRATRDTLGKTAFDYATEARGRQISRQKIATLDALNPYTTA